MRSKLYLFIILIFTHSIVFPQISNSHHSDIGEIQSLLSIKSENLSTPAGNDFQSFKNSVGLTLAAPLKWDTYDILKFGGIVALTAGSFLIDDEVNKIFTDHKTKTLDNIERLGYYYGSPISTVPATIVMYFSGLAFKNKWLKETGLMLAETISIIAIVQVPSSIIAGRIRPHSTNDNIAFHFLGGTRQEKASFISGHTAIAISISNILAHQIDNPFASTALYCLAAITSLSRLYDNQHWFSDVFIGAALGYFISDKLFG